MFSRFNSTKCKTQCKMCISRLKLMRNKRQIGLRNLRKEVAELLKLGKQGNARIRVEAVIRENFSLHAYDIVELFLELISVRVSLMEKAKEMPPDMMEAICSIIYAGDRMMTDLPEMAVLRNILVHKYSSVYGKEFATEASSELTCRKWHVNEDLVSCLAIEAPLPQQKLKLLAEIASEYDVDFDEEAAAADMVTGIAPRPSAAGPFPGMDSSLMPDANSSYPAPYGAPPPWAPQAAPPPAPAPAAETHHPQVTLGSTAMHHIDVSSMAAPGVPSTEVPQGPGWAPLGQPPAQPGDGFEGHVSSVGNWMKAKKGGQPGKGPAPEDYLDASAAADAARQYSTMAQHAAEAAEKHARSRGGTPSSSPPPTDHDSGEGGQGGGTGANVFVRRSDSEIQRAYDAAPGPPSKGEITASGPPSAPPMGPPLGAAAPAGEVRTGGGEVPGAGEAADDLGLPSAPVGGAKPAPGSASVDQDEVDKELAELTRRFEALKRR